MRKRDGIPLNRKQQICFQVHFPIVGSDGPVSWPVKFPDLNPIDFFLLGYLETSVYATRVIDLE